jgi:diguanylate cyclase (GGDEF)-like protein
VRSIDSTARYGGEEFTIILPETLYEGGIRVAEKIRSEIDMHSFNIEDRRDRLTVSIGIAVFPNDAIDKEGLIKAADDALYMAKRMGRNRVVTFQQYKAETVRAK